MSKKYKTSLKYRTPFWQIMHFVNCYVLHIADKWGMKFNKPMRFFLTRYTVGLNTYYR